MRKFKRGFENFSLEKFIKEEVYKLLEDDIEKGRIFPTLRAGEIHFYYDGGCIFSYKNRFSYNLDYHKYMGEKYVSSRNNYLIDRPSELTLEQFYNDLKLGVCKKHKSKEGKPTERQFLSQLYKSTYKMKSKDTIVLDIEMRFNESDKKKCDLVLYNNIQQKLMLVEAKMVDNKEIKSKYGTPDVIDQVRNYTSWLSKEEIIKEQYSKHIQFINTVFNTDINTEIKDICKSAKLIIFKTNEQKELEEGHKQKLIDRLGRENVLISSIENIDKININEIWKYLDK